MIFIFLDEHPDSIDDGYFLNQETWNKDLYGNPLPQQWIDLPASYHNGAASLSFADGHSEFHKWLCPSTIRPNRPDGAQPLPSDVPGNEMTDFDWVIARMSVEQ
jgi:prepilin-type processing-associated H-X9-DG protein